MPAEDNDEHFEDGLTVALRRAGDGFEADDRDGLVAGGLVRGRRRVVRRRAWTVTGSVLALAVVGVGGAYATGTLGGAVEQASVAAAPPAVARNPLAPPVDQDALVATFRQTLPPGGRLTDVVARGTGDPLGPMLSGVYDDGQGKAAVGVGFFQAPPGDKGFSTCPDKESVPYDACTAEDVSGGRLVILQGYEYPDRREETKNWRATLLAEDGLVVDLSTWNAPAQKGAAVSRTDPPFGPAELKRIVTHTAWAPVLEALRVPAGTPSPGASASPAKPAKPVKPDADGAARAAFNGAAVRPTLLSLLPKELTVSDKGGQDGYAFAVVDDGKGKSLMQVNAQPDMTGAEGELFPDGTYELLPDGTKVVVRQQPGEKGGEGVVMWTVDTIRPGGYRVVVSAFNTGDQAAPATRAEPAFSIDELKAIATSEKWLKLRK
ncbi:hypothetical protein [Streptomyces thermolilacinus]|uniref:Uncharacterized protein n=1 Tax=Streptomyces thermolilacinus SPC6 TaxID=1306406 RepID=A0A1D3DRX5_9ACTN|nr:hypothetical protein [Streptomyces thermolilacinus]OEJ95082.1 hypothetical protein J116_011875 [Streptomyces thermolilacinus SPC6]